MYQMLAYKELREIAGIALIALACYVALVTNLMGMHLFVWVPFLPGAASGVPFVSAQFSTSFTTICIAFTIALGIRQSFLEDLWSRYQLLLHLPMARDAVMLTKLLTGGLLYLVVSALPILLFGWWARWQTREVVAYRSNAPDEFRTEKLRDKGPTCSTRYAT